MPTFSTYDNVIFDIYSTAYDATIRMAVLSDAPDLCDTNGHMQDMTQFIQGLRESNNPSSKSVRYKLVVRSTYKVDTFLRESRLIRVTRFKNKYAGNWEKLAETRDYTVAKINNLDSTGKYIVVSLIDRGSDGPRT